MFSIDKEISFSKVESILTSTSADRDRYICGVITMTWHLPYKTRFTLTEEGGALVEVALLGDHFASVLVDHRMKVKLSLKGASLPSKGIRDGKLKLEYHKMVHLETESSLGIVGYNLSDGMWLLLALLYNVMLMNLRLRFSSGLVYRCLWQRLRDPFCYSQIGTYNYCCGQIAST